MLIKTMKAAVLGLSLVTVAANSAAEDHLYLGSSLGYMFWDDERFINGNSDSGAIGALNLGYEFAERFAIEGSIGTGLSGPDQDIYSVSLYNFLSPNRDDITTYWLAGLNYVESDELTVSRVSESLSAHLGIGLSNYLTNNLEFRGDIRVSKALDSDGNLGSAVDSLTEYGLNLALNYHFGDRSKPAPRPTAAPVAAPAAAPAPAPAPAPKMETMTAELDVYFNTDKDAVISYGSQLDKIVSLMKRYPDATLVLEGHTDSRASDAYNKDLSQRRANRVLNKLVQDHGIAASRIKAVGYGEERPIADNATKEGRAKNRRVIGVLTWKQRAQ